MSHAIPLYLIQKKIREMEKNDGVLQLEKTFAALDKLAIFDVDLIMEMAGEKRIKRIIAEMPRYITFMQTLYEVALNS